METEKMIKLLGCKTKKCKYFLPGKVIWTFCDLPFKKGKEKEAKNERKCCK